MPLKIAFIGYNTNLTRIHFRQFAIDNAEQVLHFDSQRGRLILVDGTFIEALNCPFHYKDGVRYDQVIIADDRRMQIRVARADDLAYLRAVTAYSEISEEYRFQVYDTDAETPRKEEKQ